jgi:hypothetical protein
MLAAGALGTGALLVVGLRAVAVAVPLFLATAALLTGAVSAALFARVAQLELGEPRPDGEDDRGFGGGWGGPGEPPGGGAPTVDWERFERDFRAYCTQLSPPARRP